MNANPMAAAPVPAGTFMAGTKVQVGSHRVVVEKYLSEGGFAHVYVVRLPKPVDGVETAVLKRVAVPDKASLANMRTEVETMKRLKGHKHIVTYIDSHASQLKGGGYEVFLLMEHCAGGGLIDFMNTRLQNRLTEPEILKIFGDVTEGVACMHYLKPPLLHRDLKVENILISGNGPSRCYKLCDFGSAAPPRPAATSAAEGRLIEDDVQRHTTLQYRSPEMIDVYRKQPIDEKSDIWALGVLLYKLCYYTTPFDEGGQMAILNAKFKYPAYPPFSDRLKLLIATMLKEHPKDRPNIYHVLRETCHMRGKEVPIRDIYADRSHSESRRSQQLPTSTPVEAPKVGAAFTPPIQETKIIPDIAPMRRGRPNKPTDQKAASKPSPSPLRVSGDPFAALDGTKRNVSTDELSSRFPTLDQFSLLHEKGGTFNFESTNTESIANPDDLSKRVTNALADEAFSKPAVSPQPSPTLGTHHTTTRIDPLVSDKKLVSSSYLRAEPSRQQVPIQQPTPQKPTMVSTGTMTSPSPVNQRPDSPSLSQRPLHRFPSQSHKKQPSGSSRESSGHDHPRLHSGSLSTRPSFARFDSKPSQAEDLPRSPASSRPSLEGTRPTASDIADPLTRSKSANSKSRPTAAYVASRLEYLRDRGRERSSDEDETLLRPSVGEHDLEYSQPSNMSDVDFLKAKEEEKLSRKREKRLSGGSKHAKRGSLSSLSLSGTKTLLAGRFGDAFRRFENNAPHDRNQTPSPENDTQHLTPITGSEVTELSDDGHGYDNVDADDISPEMKREMERRRLSMEEKRVAEAAAQYRSQLNEREGGPPRAVGLGIGSGGRAAAIENKVQSLLKETDKAPPVKTASGYGRYTDAVPNPQAKRFELPLPERPASSMQPYPSAPATSHTSDFRSQPSNDKDSPSIGLKYNTGQHQTPSTTSRAAQRPVAPPKPKSLRTGVQSANQTGNSEYNSPQHPRSTRQVSNSSEDWELNFSRRYPSLSGLELVETEIDIPKASLGRTTATTASKGL
ncbi:NAK protein kinase [Trichophyton rubrum CBS 202.88]|nr:NAK protein kinase [Trichophyton rubrum CBS 202.88]